MNKEMQKLLKAINDKKNEVKSLVKDGKLDKAREAKDELKELQEKFDLLFDLDEEEHEEIEGKVATGAAKTIGGKADKKNLVKAFVNIVKCGFLKREPDEGDVKVYKDALSTDTTKGDDDEMGIGVTVPEDIRTDIIELRRSEDNLEQYVNVEGVTTKSGSRNIEVDADSTPFDNVDEEADFPDMDEPKFKKIVYAIKKKGGILKITAELFEDTAANVMAYINKWIAKKTKATRNAMILKVADEMTKGKEVVISTIDSLKDVFNVGLDPAITTGAMVIANQNGYNYLDKLKDKDGKYILQPNPTQPTQMMLFGKYPIVKVSKRTVKSESVYSPVFTISGSKLAIDGTTTAIDASATSDVTAWKVVKGKYVVTCKGQEQETTVDAKVYAYKHPVYMGDLKEAITLFDRNVITIDMNDKAAGLWEKDMTGIKVRDRFDVQPVDDGAIIKGNITEVVQG